MGTSGGYKNGKGKANQVKTKRGIRQGCILSPTLSYLYRECLNRRTIEEHENVININDMRFADVTALLSESEKTRRLAKPTQ